MKEVKEFLLKHRSKFSQLIILDEQALIISSCDSIFDTQVLKESPVVSWFPFLESIYSNVWSMVEKDSNITFNKVETSLAELPGIYDFTFSTLTIQNKQLLLWSIYDYTDLYEDFKQFQQRKNELEIHRETLERRHKNLRSTEDIKLQQNIIIESLDHLQLTYYNKIKDALLSPVNALDGFTFLITGALETRDTKYTQQLRFAIKQLNLILDDLDTVNFENIANDFKNQEFNLLDLIHGIETLIQSKTNNFKLQHNIGVDVPDLLLGNFLYLKQTIFGILHNAAQVHPNSNYEIVINKIEDEPNLIKLHFQIVEYLNANSITHSKVDYSRMIYQLSIIRQLIELQQGQVFVQKDPKNLSISINFELSFHSK